MTSSASLERRVPPHAGQAKGTGDDQLGLGDIGARLGRPQRFELLRPRRDAPSMPGWNHKIRHLRRPKQQAVRRNSQLSGARRPPGVLGVTPDDPFEHVAQLGGRQRHRAALDDRTSRWMAPPPVQRARVASARRAVFVTLPAGTKASASNASFWSSLHRRRRFGSVISVEYTTPAANTALTTPLAVQLSLNHGKAATIADHFDRTKFTV